MRYLLAMMVLLLVVECTGPAREGYGTVVKTKFHVTEVYKCKYSKVKGYIEYNGTRIYCDNGGTGYYYKSYRLSHGDVIDITTTVYTSYIYNGVNITVGDIDISKYETK